MYMYIVENKYIYIYIYMYHMYEKYWAKARLDIVEWRKCFKDRRMPPTSPLICWVCSTDCPWLPEEQQGVKKCYIKMHCELCIEKSSKWKKHVFEEHFFFRFCSCGPNATKGKDVEDGWRDIAESCRCASPRRSLFENSIDSFESKVLYLCDIKKRYLMHTLQVFPAIYLERKVLWCFHLSLTSRIKNLFEDTSSEVIPPKEAS